MSFMMTLEKEFKYYLDNQKQLIKDYQGKYLVVKNEQVIDAYGSQEEAIQETMKTHQLGTFLVQYVQADGKNILQTFHSRVIFARS